MAAYPFVLLLALVYFVIRCAFKPKSLSQAYLFRGEELDQMKEILTAIVQLERERVDIEEEGEDLERRSDGFYDGRSYQGRRLNKRLTEMNEALELNKDCERELRGKVEKRLSSWNANRTGRAVFFAALIAYLPVAVITSEYALPMSILAAVVMWVVKIVKAKKLENYMPNLAR